MLTSQLDISLWFNWGYWRENTSMNIVWYMIKVFAWWSKQHRMVTQMPMSNLYLDWLHVTSTRGNFYSVTKCAIRTCSLYRYIAIIVFPHMDNTQSAGYNGFSEKKMNEKLAQEKCGHPIKWTFHLRRYFYQFTNNLIFPWLKLRLIFQLQTDQK